MSDSVASLVGSWTFLIWQTLLIVAWVIWNSIPGLPHFDTYPFIFLTLLLSLQAAYAAPIILMSQNRQGERDRAQASADYETNVGAKEEIEQIQIQLSRLEDEKLEEILSILRK